MNRLAEATSPYLLQHAENPVDWFEWGDDAFERARAEDRPLLVSVGYSSCHWCHVMAHESFEDAGTAALMNELFVNVKVDREERPDVDAATMEATVGMTGSGGWPTTVFMTPDGKAFYAGTYFPPESRHGIPSFRDVLEAVSKSWRERRADVDRQAGRIDEALRSIARTPPSREPLTASLLGEATRGIARTFDRELGGFGRAPKFPAASTLEHLLRRDDDEALAMVTATLDGMAAGGMYDVVGGGFHRYSVDDRWLVPHFEKMLYDNALLASTYLHAWVVTGRQRYRDVTEETVQYMLRELALPGGGFASAQDADTEGVEGLTYTWAAEEADAAGIPSDRLEAFEHGRLIVRGELEPDLRAQVLAIRDERVQPFRDEKALASWNGLALAALAEAAYRLEREDWLAAARDLGEFLLGALSDADGRLFRSVREGRTSGHGFLDDYANVANGLLELHVATGEVRWLLEAERLARLAVELFGDETNGGFYLASAGGDERVPRTKDLQDTPIPSGNSMLAWVLLRLSRLWGDDELERLAVGVFRLVEPALRRAPGAFAWALAGLDLWFSPPKEIAVAGDVGAPVARAALAPFQPNTVIAVGPSDDVPLLAGKDRVNGETAVYVLRAVCLPTTGYESGGAMRVCLMIEGQEGVTWDDWVRIASLAESKGFDGMFRSDHYSAIVRPQAAALDAWTTLAGLAVVTKRIRLGTLVSPATYRHPSVLARMGATVDHISNGRVEVGLGAGWYEREHLENGFPFLDAKARFDLFAEQVEIVVRTWTEDGFDHTGPAYTLKGQTALPKPVQQPHPPLVLGGTGKPRFAALAARYATEVNTLGARNEELRERKERIDRACVEAGRDPKTLIFSVMTACFVGVDRAEAVERVRRFLAVQGGDGDPETLIAERRDRWLVGTVDEVVSRIEELRALGATRVFLQHLDHSDDEMVALIGDQLIPAVESS